MVVYFQFMVYCNNQNYDL